MRDSFNRFHAFIRHLRPTSLAGRLALAGITLWLSMVLLGGFFLPGVWRDLFSLIGRLLLLTAFLSYLARLGTLFMRRFLWKIRRRLILAYIFAAIIPMLLLFSIIALSSFLVYYQLMHFLLANQITLQSAQLEALSSALHHRLGEIPETSLQNRDEFQRFLDREAQFIQANFPQAALYVQVEFLKTGEKSLFFSGTPDPAKGQNYQLPLWLEHRDFSGIVFEPLGVPDHRIASAQRTVKTSSRSNLSLRSVFYADVARWARISVEVVSPLDRDFLRKIKSALGLELFLLRSDGESGGAAERPGQSAPSETSSMRTLASTQEFASRQELQGKGKYLVNMSLYPILWENGKETASHLMDTLMAELSLSGLYRQLFLSENRLRQNIADILQFLLLFFLAAEILSLIIGVVLTKSITGAVYNLDKGVQYLNKGDFSHRIIVKSDDQLGNLADSFNKMSHSLQDLLQKMREKERMDRELEIAKEVQSKLFPKCAPALSGLDVCGICLPARSVSGDFFDYLTLSPQILGITIGDICGKGISAALLMANLQATVRSQVACLIPTDDGMNVGLWKEEHLSAFVDRLNQHVLDFTESSKFATFFVAVFDQNSSRLTYCNAGHNHPFMLQQGAISRLKTGGTVIGIFAEATFSQETILLNPGDIFLGYTDGLTEATNEFGEEFGEDRLTALLLDHAHCSVNEIQEKIIQSVQQWVGGKEPEDDVTLIVAQLKHV